MIEAFIAFRPPELGQQPTNILYEHRGLKEEYNILLKAGYGSSYGCRFGYRFSFGLLPILFTVLLCSYLSRTQLSFLKMPRNCFLCNAQNCPLTMMSRSRELRREQLSDLNLSMPERRKITDMIEGSMARGGRPSLCTAHFSTPAPVPEVSFTLKYNSRVHEYNLTTEKI